LIKFQLQGGGIDHKVFCSLFAPQLGACELKIQSKKQLKLPQNIALEIPIAYQWLRFKVIKLYFELVIILSELGFELPFSLIKLYKTLILSFNTSCSSAVKRAVL
jgi:hypothetical protein